MSGVLKFCFTFLYKVNFYFPNVLISVLIGLKISLLGLPLIAPLVLRFVAKIVPLKTLNIL